MKDIIKQINKSNIEADYALYRIKINGNTASRPVLSTNDVGFQYYDTTLGKPVWWDGATWKDAAGTVV